MVYLWPLKYVALNNDHLISLLIRWIQIPSFPAKKSYKNIVDSISVLLVVAFLPFFYWRW